MKTRVEIDELIARWLEDPDWELEESDGFEDHKDELLAVRHKHEAEWKAQEIAALIKPALAVLPPNLVSAAQTPGTDLHLALGLWAEMLLPIKRLVRWLEQNGARDTEGELSELSRRLRKLERRRS